MFPAYLPSAKHQQEASRREGAPHDAQAEARQRLLGRTFSQGLVRCRVPRVFVEHRTELSKLRSNGFPRVSSRIPFYLRSLLLTNPLSTRWRSGPTGPKSLCNACGLRWAKVQKGPGTGGSPGSSASSSLTGNLQQANLGSPLQSPTQNTFNSLVISPGHSAQTFSPYIAKVDLDTPLWQQ